MTHVLVVGAGLAGLTAAVTAREAGADVTVMEAADTPGGTTLLSSGWIWRYDTAERLAWGAPGGRSDVQAAVHNGCDDAVRWLDSATQAVLERETPTPFTKGVRIDPHRAIADLVARLPGDAMRCNARLEFDTAPPPEVDAVVLAGGGYGGALTTVAFERGTSRDAYCHWQLRNATTSTGGTIDWAVRNGAEVTHRTGGFYGRALPHGVDMHVRSADDFTRLACVFAAKVAVLDDNGRLLTPAPHDWADAGIVQQWAHRTGRAWYIIAADALQLPTPYGSIDSVLRRSEEAGGTVVRTAAGEMRGALSEYGLVPHDAEAASALEGAVAAVAVVPGITHTTGGLAVIDNARVAMLDSHEDALPIFAAGVDVGGVAGDGYVSGLAQALVLGRIAGANAAAVRS